MEGAILWSGAVWLRQELVDSKLRHDQYIGILQNTMLPSMSDLFGDSHAIFMHDNDPKHTARATKQWLDSQEFQVLKWLPQSPDLNPVENMWKILSDKRYQVEIRLTNETQLWQVCKEAWSLITPDECRKLI